MLSGIGEIVVCISMVPDMKFQREPVILPIPDPRSNSSLSIFNKLVPFRIAEVMFAQCIVSSSSIPSRLERLEGGDMTACLYQLLQQFQDHCIVCCISRSSVGGTGNQFSIEIIIALCKREERLCVLKCSWCNVLPDDVGKWDMGGALMLS